jgi:hypothetical protein
MEFVVEFTYREIRLEPIMAVGTAVSALSAIGSMPEPVAEIVRRCLRDSPFTLGRARFPDGREYWTLTGSGISKKGVSVRRTSVYAPSGHAVFSGKRDGKGTLFTMEGRRLTKIVKQVMKS